MLRDLPPWHLPIDIGKRLARDGEWEDERYAPIRWSVGGDGSAIADWQIEIYPGTPTQADAGLGPARDGYDLCERCLRHIAEHDADIAERVHDDSENATCVLWVEAEDDARDLTALVWSLVFGAPDV